MDYLIRQGVCLPDTQKRDFCIIDGKISKHTEQLTGREYKVIDLNGRMVLRGFADVHMHLDKALLNSRGENVCSLTDAIQQTHAYKKQAKREEIYDRARRAAEECFRQGTRWIRTHVDVDDLWGLEAWEAIRQLKADMKAEGKLDIQIVAFPQEGIMENLENRRLLEEALKRGADLIGGIPAVEKEAEEHVDVVMGLAKKYNLDVDMHVDETDDPKTLTIQYLIRKAESYQWQGRITAGHLCSLGANIPSKRRELLSGIVSAGIKLVTLPSTNLYLQGRSDEVNPRRGILPVREALEIGISVAAASDNMQDFFNPFGRGNILDQAYLAANCCYMSTKEEMWKAFGMVTSYPAQIMGVNPWIQEGDSGDFIILDALSASEALIWRKPLFGYFKNGELMQ